jgi:hypothetical protein
MFIPYALVAGLNFVETLVDPQDSSTRMTGHQLGSRREGSDVSEECEKVGALRVRLRVCSWHCPRTCRKYGAVHMIVLLCSRGIRLHPDTELKPWERETKPPFRESITSSTLARSGLSEV